MPSTTSYRRGDIVLVSFPFTDLSSSKRRPALVISPDSFNEQGQDVVLIAITSQEPDDNAVTIDEHDCVDGELPKRSFVKLSKLFTVHSTLVLKKMCALRSEKIDDVLLGRYLQQLNNGGGGGRCCAGRSASAACRGARDATTLGFSYGGGAPTSPLYGIWDIEEMSVDGVIRLPLVNDWGRWKRAIFQAPTGMTLQRMDDSFVNHVATIDVSAKTLALTRPASSGWTAQLAFERPAPERLILDGDMDGHKIRMKLRLHDRDKFLLVTRGFHWIQEVPFNR